MEKKMVQVYVAVDGREFATELECVTYEEELLHDILVTDLLEQVDDIIQFAFYQRKVLGDTSLKLRSLRLTSGESYYPKSDDIYKALKEEMYRKGVYLHYREVYNQFADLYYEVILTDEKYKELLGGSN